MTAVNRFFHQRGISEVFFILALNVSIEKRPSTVGPTPPLPTHTHSRKSARSTHETSNVCSSCNADELMGPAKTTHTHTQLTLVTSGRALDYCSIQTTTRLGGIRQQTTSAQAAEQQQQRTFGIIDASRMTRWCLSLVR